MTDEYLKPCPHCGRLPWGLFGPTESSGEHWVECHGPHGTGGGCGFWYYEGTRDETRAAWNRRAP